MGIIALVVLSVTVAWTLVAGGPNVLGNAFNFQRIHLQHYWFESGRALKRNFEYEPPARKSVVVDISGMSYRSADGSQMTKRDRSRLFPRLDVQLPTETSAARTGPEMVPTQNIPTLAVASAPLGQGQIEEMPLATPPASLQTPIVPVKVEGGERAWSLGRRVQTEIRDDNTLSRSARLTLRAVSVRGRVTLSGIVLEQSEKDYIGKKAEEIAGAGNVDNRLTVL